MSAKAKKSIVAILLLFTTLLCVGVGVYFYKTMQEQASTEDKDALHLDDIKTASNISEMIDASDVVVLGTYEGLDSTWNMARNPDDLSQPSKEEYIGGKIYHFHVDDTLKGDLDEEGIKVNHLYAERFDIEETLGYKDQEVENAAPTFINPSFKKTYIVFLKNPEIDDIYMQAIEPFLISIDKNENLQVQSKVMEELNFNDTITGESLETIKQEFNH